jgi:hypothetical protein
LLDKNAYEGYGSHRIQHLVCRIKKSNPKNSNPKKSNTYFFDTLIPILSQEIFSPFQKSRNMSLLRLEQVIYMQ